MLKSMTGFGRCDILADGYRIQVQIKAVNHRYSDFTIKMPRFYTFLEDAVRSLAIERITRGKVEIQLNIEKEISDDKVISLDKPTAEGYINALRSLTEYGLTDDLSVSSMTSFHDIFHIENKEINEELLLRIVTDAFGNAADEFDNMRCAEGARLESSMYDHLAALRNEISAVELLSPKSVEEYREKLRQRIEEVLNSSSIDENRILTEAAIFADKTAVDEETVRLNSHIKSFETAMAANKPIGKKLDFIVQEMNREANTIGSKANNIEIANHVVEIKSLIEKIREQIQNIE